LCKRKYGTSSLSSRKCAPGNQGPKNLEETVEKALTDRGKAFVGLSITENLTRLNDTMKTNEERTNGEFDVGFGKFFKTHHRCHHT
jgi:hypothetical protein